MTDHSKITGIKYPALIVLALLCSACSTIHTDALSKDEAERLAHRTVITSRYEQLPDFAVKTAANVQFGPFGVVTAVSNGNAMLARHHIEDPAIEIARRLAEGLGEHHQMKVMVNDGVVADSNRIAALVSRYHRYDYILDVQTVAWGAIYYLSDWNRYKVRYKVQVRLIEGDTQRIIAEQVCRHVPEYVDTSLAPSYDSLENGDGLQTELKQSIKFCVEQMNHIKNLGSRK